MRRIERTLSVILLWIMCLSNILTPVSYAAELHPASSGAQSTSADSKNTKPLPRPSFKQPASGSVLGASTSLLEIGTQTLDETQGTAGSANKRIPIRVQTLAKKVYQTTEDVSLAVSNPDNEAFTTAVIDADNKPAPVTISEANNGTTTTVQLAPSNELKPGVYKISVTDQAGNTTQQDFSWGVLALNFDKSMYHPGETGNISIGVLNDKGDMVCDAQVTLQITNTSLGIDDTLSTSATGSAAITINPQCQKHDFSLQPDYEAHYNFAKAGTYHLQLTAITVNGTKSVSDSIQVTDQIPFDVQRVSATRIYPPNTYPMTFNITAHQDFSGTVTETVPDSFTITPASQAASESYTTMQTMYLNATDPGAQLHNLIATSSAGLSMPFQGTYPITQGFGTQLTDPTLQAFYTHYGLAGHDGVDFGLPMNTPLYSVDDGTVIWSGPGDYGTMVTILHSWGQTYYGHMSNISVTVGQHVTKGQLIGYSGMSGEATGPHLHFGMKPLHPDITNGYYGKVDPMPYLPFGHAPEDLSSLSDNKLATNALNKTAVLGSSDAANLSPAVSPTILPTETPAAPAISPTGEPTQASSSAQPTSVTATPTSTPTLSSQTAPAVPANENFSVLEKEIQTNEALAASAQTQKVKVISWQVKLKKGEQTTLGYNYQAPHVSPQFYLLGPLKFYQKGSAKVVFQEQRQWQIASDDVGIEWYQNTSGNKFNGYSWQYRKKVTIDHTKVNGITPVVVDSVNGGSNITWSHNVCGGGCSNPALLVSVAVSQTLDVNLSATAKYNGTSMTQLALVHMNGAQNGFLVVFGLLNPTTGTHTVEVDVTGGFAVVTGGSESFANVTSFGTPSTNSGTGGTTVSTPAITTTSGNILAGFIANGSSITSVNAPGTSRYIANYTGGLFGGNSAGATTPATGGSDSITWNLGTDDWAVAAVEVKGSSVTYDATGPSTSGYTPTAISSMSWNHTVSGTNPALLAEIAVSPTGGSDAGMTVSATYNGTSMTQLSFTHLNTNQGFLAVFGLTSAPTGTHTIAITISGGTGQEVTDGSISFNNVGAFGTAATNSGLSGQQSTGTIASTTGDIVAGFVASGSGINAVSSPATKEFTATIDSSTGAGNSGGAISLSTGSNVTIKWPANADQWAASAVELQAIPPNGTFTNFPVEVNIPSDSDLSAKAQSSGADILFTDSNGRDLLPYEIESYNSGALVAWVNVPSVSSSADKIIYMYYGNPSASSLANNTTWDSNFKAVWHLPTSQSSLGDISTTVYSSKSFSVNTQDTFPYDEVFSPDGTKMYMSGGTNHSVFQYTLSTAWDVSTATYASKSVSVNSQDANPFTVAFSTDGTTMFILGGVNKTVFQYSLSTAWDVSTATYASKSFLLTGQDSSPFDISFSTDGTKLYMLGHTNSAVYQYTLSTAWDISTATYASKSVSVSGQDNGGTNSMKVSADGTKMYMQGNTTTKTFYQYNLSTAGDISTASYASKSFTESQDTSPGGFFISPNGTGLYMMGGTNKTVYEYYLGSLTVSDSTSNGNNGTNSGATAAIGKIDGAALFSASHISTSVDAAVNNLEATAAKTWTTETWFNTSTTGTIVILGRSTNIGASSTFTEYLVNGALDFRLKGTLTTVNSGTSYNDGKWHSVGVTWDGTTALAYVDGVPANLNVGTAALQTVNVCIGAIASTCTTSPFTGLVDEVRLSNIARSFSWMESTYNTESSPGPGSFISSFGSAETNIYAPTMSQVMRGGKWFDSTGTEQPFVF